MRLLPDSIIGRAVLVILLGLLISHLIGLALYSEDRYSSLAASRGRHAAEHIGSLAALIEATPAVERPALLASMRRPGVRAGWSPDTPLVSEDGGGWRERMIRASLLSSLQKVAPERLRVAIADADEDFAPSIGVGQGMGQGMGMGMHRRMARGYYRHALRVSLQLTDASWLNFTTSVERFDTFWTSRLFFTFVLVTAVVIVLSIWAVRRAAAPLELFTRAAERLGLDVNAPPLPEDGPREVRRAARAFNSMQDRLRAFIGDRTHMLAAISHDLRTPITRLKLRAEFLDNDEQQKKMLADLDEMEKMIAATLSFAQDDAAHEPRKALDLAALLIDLCDDQQAASYDGPQSLVFEGRPLALKRAFANLIGNAVAYGGMAEVSLNFDGEAITLTVDDNGPGIPEAELERVFAPFRRLETSRSRETGGVGLGLASARTLIRAHGGDITLKNRPQGGLRARVELPLQG